MSIVQILEEEIALGFLRPRERLVEDELMARFNTKRHTVRQALVELETMGIVARQANRGATVRDFTMEEVEHLYVVRDLLESKAAALIPLPADAGLIADLRAIHSRHAAATHDGNIRAVFRENLLFHRTFFAACGNSALAEAIEIFANRAHGIRSYTIRDASLLQKVLAEHEGIIEALEGADREKLITLVAQHIQPAKEAYLRIAAIPARRSA